MTRVSSFDELHRLTNPSGLLLRIKKYLESELPKIAGTINKKRIEKLEIELAKNLERQEIGTLTVKLEFPIDYALKRTIVLAYRREGFDVEELDLIEGRYEYEKGLLAAKKDGEEYEIMITRSKDIIYNIIITQADK